jgi:serine/threonine protein kinase
MLAFLDKKDSLAGCPVLGAGEHGWVYRVPLQDDLVVAIECVPNPADDYLAQKHYWALESLGFIRHRNLVQLLAYVFGTNSHFLVYEFVPGGSLQDALNKLLGNELTLSWPQRHRILCGVARGLAYLHDGSLGSYFVHRNLNSTKILLDEGYEAKIGDFSRAFSTFRRVIHPIDLTDCFVAPERQGTGR